MTLDTELKSKKEISSNSKTTYDEVPYIGGTYPSSHPRNIATVAKVFGLAPPATETARVLEIGCASGSNLIPMAMAAPQSTFLGIDLSLRQIEDGRKQIESLEINNIILEHMSVSDISSEIGPFDYIICHGVFSWVPQEVQKDIMRVCSENLTKNGLVYISYNTLPGWNSIKSIRDMMLYHTAQFDDPNVKIDEAVKMMRFVASGLPQEDSIWRKTIETELKNIENLNGWYVYHEHLENENHPLYFHEFMKIAEDNNMQYLGDSQLSTMYVGALAKPVADTLSQLTDLVRQEQYMDFVRNRRFRMSILTKKSQTPNHTVPQERINIFYLSADKLLPDFDTTQQNWSQDTLRTFNNKAISTKNRYFASLLSILCEQRPRIFSLDELVKVAAKRVGPSDEATFRKAWTEFAMKLCFMGYLAVHDSPYDEMLTVSERPVALPITRYQSTLGELVPNTRHESIKLDKATLVLLPLLDGSLTVPELSEPYAQKLEEAGANFLDGDKPTQDPDRRLEIAANQVQNCLEVCRFNKLLIK